MRDGVLSGACDGCDDGYCSFCSGHDQREADYYFDGFNMNTITTSAGKIAVLKRIGEPR